MKTTFTGFSTVGGTPEQSYRLYDVALVRQDLLNHFHTRMGERVMRPEYGCRIWDYLMEPFTSQLKGRCAAEATRICQSDPRVNLVSLHVSSLDHGIRVEVTLDYYGASALDTFIIDFENRQSEAGF